MKVKTPPPPKLPPPPRPAEVKLEAPKINMPKIDPKPALKPIEMEAKLNTPQMKEAKPAIVLAPQPKAALTAAMPAQSNTVKASTAPVHLGDTFGVTPNPNASRPAQVAAIGNPYGGMQGPAVAPHGVVGSTGIGNGLKAGSNAGTVGKVASAGIPERDCHDRQCLRRQGSLRGNSDPDGYDYCGFHACSASGFHQLRSSIKTCSSIHAEARQLRVQGDVILRVTFTASGQVLIKGVVRGLGHGLDEEARRVAEQIRFRPATRNGQAVDLTTNITITFQLA